MKMKPFTLAKEKVSHETVEALRYLLGEAERGELIGIAYAAMLKRRSCIVDTAGEDYRNPLFALGMVCMLSADIADRSRQDPE